jgi:hypothetical protein
LPSYELEPFTTYPAVRVVIATDFILPAKLKLLFWVIDPEQQIVWPKERKIEQRAPIKSDPDFSFNNETDFSLDGFSMLPAVDEHTTDYFDLGYPRQDFLWEQTCFEVFVGIKKQSTYREINLSPVGQWNCYQFDGYRTPETMPPVRAKDIQLLDLSFQQQKLYATIDLHDFLEQHQCKLEDLNIGINSVIKVKNDRELYFALKHSGNKADFHRQQDWTLRL